MLAGNDFDKILDPRRARGYGGRFYGVYPAEVVDIEDPDNTGQVRVRLPWSPDGDGQSYEAWGRIATLMAGDNRGSWFIPDVGDEVLVCFQAGDPRYPYIIGMLWNGQDAPTESSSADNNIKSIRSRNGVKITMDDTNGTESITVETPGGNSVTLKDGPGSIELRDSNGNDVTLDSSGITLNAAASVTISCSMMSISAGMVSVDTPMAQFSGVVQSNTNITTTTVSSTYTPGAGNIW